jgi:hypothetical protein
VNIHEKADEFGAYLLVVSQQNLGAQMMDDVQKLLRCRHEVTQGTEAISEVPRTLTEIYYRTNGHAMETEKERGRGEREEGRKERKTTVAQVRSG